jgi:hypothetical protein
VTEPRCERTELLVSQCSHCRGDEDLPGNRDALPPPSAWTTARYEGHCPECEGDIDVGDRIALCGDVWVCGSCGGAA